MIFAFMLAGGFVLFLGGGFWGWTRHVAYDACRNPETSWNWQPGAKPTVVECFASSVFSWNLAIVVIGLLVFVLVVRKFEDRRW